MSATQVHKIIKEAQSLDVFNYALHRQGMSGNSYPNKIKKVFKVGEYKYDIRPHDPGHNAPPGSKSAKWSIYRLGRNRQKIDPETNQGYGWEYASPNDDWFHTTVLKDHGLSYYPITANDSHIPVPNGVIP